LSNAEKAELILIAMISVIFWFFAPKLPVIFGFGKLLLDLSAILLFQSLIRDLWLLTKKKHEAQTSPKRLMRCMCIESTIGAIGVIIGAFLLGSGLDQPIIMEQWMWGTIVMVTMSFCFVIKDYVIKLNPLRIRKDKDHQSIVFTWKS
jgi:hypothetical protein